MASASANLAGGPSCGALLMAHLAEQGSAVHPFASGQAVTRTCGASLEQADLVHYLCVLHGRYPGLVDHAALRVVEPEARAWLANAAYAFAGERAYLARIAVAAGPVPATPGGAGSDAAVLSQRHAMETLAQSERRGCALGAAVALVLDWAVIRRSLDAAAERFGLERPAYPAADFESAVRLVDDYASAPAVQRALLFGAQQILLQHQGLWDLLEARSQARAAA